MKNLLYLKGSRDFQVGDVVIEVKDKFGWYTCKSTVVAVTSIYFRLENSDAEHSAYDGFEFKVEREMVESDVFEVGVKELKLGDEILEYKTSISQTWKSADGCFVRSIDYNSLLGGLITTVKWPDGRVRWYESYSTPTRYKVRRAAVKPVVSGRWNGTCRCGKGTYTGFLQIEHDGPCQMGLA